jgi:hypothetical protein
LVGKQLKGAVKVYDVAKLKGLRAETELADANGDWKPAKVGIYAIATERLQPLSAVQKAIANGFNQSLIPYRSRLQLVGGRGVTLADAGFDKYKAMEECTDEGYDQLTCAANVSSMVDAVNEVAKETGVFPIDVHGGNWGLRNGRMVLLDFGVSTGGEDKTKIRQLAGVGKKGKKMAKRKHRRHLGQTDMAVYDPSQPSRVVGFNWRNPWVIGGAAAALGLVAWLAFGKKDKKKAAASSGAGVSPPLPATGGGGVVIPTTASSTTPAAPVRVRASAGDSWSTLARKYYGNWQWWPALWDANRSGGSKFADPSMLRVGDDIVVPVLPVNDTAFRAAVFARSKAYQTWYRTSGGKISSRNPLPATVTEFTSAPTQNAAAGTQVSSQTAAESSSGQKALPPASSSSMSAEEKLQSDAEDAWNALDNTEG